MRERIVHTRCLLWADGMTLAPWLIVLHPRGRGDAGLIAHERVHAAQMRRDGMARFLWRYLVSRGHRLTYEVEAWRVSIAHGAAPDAAARALAQGYRLGIDADQALVALQRPTDDPAPAEAVRAA